MPRFDPPFVKSFSTHGDPDDSALVGEETHHFTIDLQIATLAQVWELAPADGLTSAAPTMAKPREWIPIETMTHTGTGQAQVKDKKKSEWIQVETATLEGQGSGKGRGILEHELTHTSGGRSTKSFLMLGLARKGRASMPFDVYMGGSKGQRITPRKKQGRALLEGNLADVKRVGFQGSDWEITLSGVMAR
ncbi:MAG: hypothetical protein MK180_09820 [Rhodobacteraceae bacterium]|nr:hypothetical protein [Paracoccaceae bacterium]